MVLQINELLEKYWNGETSLEEEQRIKSHFVSNPELTKDGYYFRYLSKQKQVEMEEFKPSAKSKQTWVSAAAIIAIGLFTAMLVFNNANRDPFAEKDPEKALIVTKKALMMIGAGLHEGQHHSMELTKINKAKEELQEDVNPEEF
ncbi:MAG: hypothetical protein AAGC64_10120 [Bacteroidota bacterium]